MNSIEEIVKRKNELMNSAGRYSEARGMIGISKFISYVLVGIGALMSVVGLITLLTAEEIFPLGLLVNRVLIIPGILFVWLGLNSISTAQIKQATLDASEAAILDLHLSLLTRKGEK
jgi:sulfite exporter TauE/SafE